MKEWNRAWVYDNCVRPVIESDIELISKIIDESKNFMNKLVLVDNKIKAVGDVDTIIKLIIEKFMIIQKKNVTTAIFFFIKNNIIPITFIEDNFCKFPDPLMLFIETKQSNNQLVLYFEPFLKQINKDMIEIDFTVSKIVSDDQEIAFTYISDLSEVKNNLEKNLDIYKDKELSRINKLRTNSNILENTCLYGKQIEEIFNCNIRNVMPSNRTIRNFNKISYDEKEENVLGYGPPCETLPKAPKLEEY